MKNTASYIIWGNVKNTTSYKSLFKVYDNLQDAIVKVKSVDHIYENLKIAEYDGNEHLGWAYEHPEVSYNQMLNDSNQRVGMSVQWFGGVPIYYIK